MTASTRSEGLLQALDIDDGALVALIGAGGKTTTMRRLAAALAVEHRVLLTTTTKIWPIPGVHTILASTKAGVRARLTGFPGAASLVTLAASLGDDGKLRGVPPELLSELAGQIDRIILCEADGAAGRPLKIHGPGEPVIPKGATHVLVIAGIDCVGRVAGPDIVHRVERYREVTGAIIGQPIEPVHVARALFAAATFAPPANSLSFLLNKADSPGEQATAANVAGALRQLRPGARILATGRGGLAEELS